MNRDIITNFSLFIIFLKLQSCYPGASWVTFDAPGWLDKDPYGIHTFLLSIIIATVIVSHSNSKICINSNSVVIVKVIA